MYKSIRSFSACARVIGLLLLMTLAGGIQAATTLSDNPVYSSTNVPANLMLALSVEFPTGIVAAYSGSNDYQGTALNPTGGNYLGYFDGNKCYDYDSTNNYFKPVAVIGTLGALVNCTGHWSGNLLNWASMTALDEFRQALTGGYRYQDDGSKTVLERARQATPTGFNNYSFPLKQITGVTALTTVGNATLAAASNLYMRVYNTTNATELVNSSDTSNPGVYIQFSTNKTFADATSNLYYVRVLVCVPRLLESNCNSAHASSDYPGAGIYNKPEGLIQQNYTKVRVGTSAYGFINANSKANGVVRALLRDVGPTQYNGNGNRSANANAEWDATTGIFVANPDGADNATTPGNVAFTKSGSINYLNQFGYANGYEVYDTLADLYWATLAYYMQVPLGTTYTNGLSATNSLDTSFPYYDGTTKSPLNDPISYSCQANAILTIGDSHTNKDTVVPSSGSLTSSNGGALPVVPANGTVPAVDANTYTTALGNLPLIEGATPSLSYAQYVNSGTPPALGTMNWYSNNASTQSTYYIAGLAYFAHTNDIRNDISATPETPQTLETKGKQTVDTYAVDVLEPGPFDGSSTSYAIYNPSQISTAGPNIYWLAAKYGGFNDVNGDGIPANFLTWHTNSTTAAANTLQPDNYFKGNQPNLLQTGLQQIFTKVASSSKQSGAGPTVTSTRSLASVTPLVAPYYAPVAGFPVYNTSYKPVSWDGDVSGYVANATPGSITPATGSTPWSAQTQLETLTQASVTSGTTTSVIGWKNGRRVITSNGSATSPGVAFRYGSLSSSEQSALGNSTTGPLLLNFLRGDKSNELTMFRARTHILGDIVDSQAAIVQAASSPFYTEAANPGYTAFSASVASRSPVVYVGANDGMLHAFEADFSTSTSANPYTGGGSELFAYVPSLLYQGPNATPQVDGLAALANLNGVTSNNYSHHFYVDRTPQVADVDFNLTGFKPTGGNPKWQTLLVGGLGKGGKGIYALNVTTVPSSIAVSSTTDTSTAEGTLARSEVLWEFTATDMGYSFGRPLIVKTRKYGWVVAVTSGYNNPSGNGHLYLLNASTGALLEQIDVPTTYGSTTNPIGLTQATGYSQNVADGTIEQLYVGDLLGNVWRFDLSATPNLSTDKYPAPTLFATLKDSSGNAQPITTAPRIAVSLNAGQTGTLRWVFVGTGQFLDSGDLNNTQQQTMYALRDGTGTAPSVSPLAVSPTTINLPLTRSLLVKNDLVTPLGLSDSSLGWYYDLPNTASGAGTGSERIVVDPDTTTGIPIVTWASVTPSSNPCSLISNIYAANFGGTSALAGGQPSIQLTSATTSVQIILLPNGTYGIVAGGNTVPNGNSIYSLTQPTQGLNVYNQVNWREILD